MKHTTTWMKWIGAGAIVLTGVAGCGNDKDGNGSVADEAANSMAGTADNVGEAVDNATTTVANGVANAGKAIEGAGDAAIITPKIKTALGANPSLRGSMIDVDTNGTKNVVTLRGTVMSNAQKMTAMAIAKKNAPTFKIQDNLKMSGGKMSGGKMSGGKM